MRVRGNLRPERFWLELDGNTATAYFTENVKEIDESGDGESGFVGWEYDRYKIEKPYDDRLRTCIEEDIPGWIAYVKFNEKVDEAQKVHKRRNELIAATDWTVLPDVPLSTEAKQAWQEYRQALRDVDSDHIDTYPYNIVWPTPPDVE